MNAQNTEQNSKLGFEYGLSFGVESFISSDLSILDNQPQGNYNASSFGANIGIHTNVDNDEFSFGLGLLGSFLQPNNSENIALYAAGIYVDDYFPFNERFGAKISYGMYWRYYVNNFTVENKDYKYKKHGVMVPLLAGLYFKPTKNIFIEATI